MISRQTYRGVLDTSVSAGSIEVSNLDRAHALVKLAGEFDIDDLDALRKVVGGASGSGKVTCVDLSEVTFLDLLCARELAEKSSLTDGCLILHDPSRQAESSFAVCSLEGMLDARVTAEEEVRRVILKSL